MNAFYTTEELLSLGFQAVGESVLISRKCSIYQADKISLGHHVRIDDFTVLSGGSGIHIGSYVHIACFCGLFGGGGIHIGNFSTLSSRCAVYSVSDDFSGSSMTNPTVPIEFKSGLTCKPVRIGDHVVVGTNSTILPGVCLNEGVAIGAHTLIKENCDPWTIYAGNPARKLKDRNQNAKTQAEPLEEALKRT